jgi:hypothetical protein
MAKGSSDQAKEGEKTGRHILYITSLYIAFK